MPILTTPIRPSNATSYDHSPAGNNYDAANQLTNLWHRQTSGGTTNTLSRYQFLYDDAGNRTNLSATVGSLSRSEGYSYDAADQLIGVTYATNGVVERTVSYAFDAAGNRTNVVDSRTGFQPVSSVYSANTLNQYTDVTAPTNLITVTGYVEPGPRSNKWYASVAGARGQAGAVNPNDGTFAIPNVSVTPGTNSLTVTVTDVSGNVATQVVNFTVGTSVSYDANGNQTTSGAWTMSYDRENRLVSATSASLAVNYSYDALGRLIERRTAGSVASTNRMYYAGWQMIAEYNGAGTLQRKYVYGPGIDEPIKMTSTTVGSTNYYFHADGLGSVTEITGSTGQLVESYRYDVYGTPTFLNAAGSTIPASAIGNRLLFTGRDRDPDTTWYNYRHRYYNPTLGRFVQPDPVGIRGGHHNLYKFCANNPATLLDPYGLAERTSGFWTLWGNSLNNTADAVGSSFGALIYDATHLTWSGDIYGDAASLLWSTDRPAAPEATPYVAAGMGISACAATTAGAMIGSEWLASRGVMQLSNRALGHLWPNGERYWSETAVREAIRNGPRLSNWYGNTLGQQVYNGLTTFQYPVGNGNVVLNWVTRTVVHYFPF